MRWLIAASSLVLALYLSAVALFQLFWNGVLVAAVTGLRPVSYGSAFWLFNGLLLLWLATRVRLD